MNYFELTATEIFNNKEILKDFLSLYSEKSGELNLNASCEKCILDYQKKLFYLMETSNKNYVWQKKYDGIFFKTDYINNQKLTDEIAKDFIKVRELNTDELLQEYFSKYPKKEIEILENETLEKISKRKNK